MSKYRQIPADGSASSLSQKIHLPKVVYMCLPSQSAKCVQRPKPKPSAKIGRSRTASMPNKSTRIALASIPVNEFAEKILFGVLAEIETLPMLRSALTQGATPELVGLRDTGIPYRPAEWYGVALDCAARQSYSRAAIRLEAHGVLRRITEPRRDRVTHLQLTATGLRLALSRAGRRADRSAIAEGLRLTRWGKDLAANLSAGKKPVKDAAGR